MHRAKTAKEALKKAQKQQQKEGRDAQRQLETVSKASSSWPRKRQKTQKEHEESVVVVIELEPEMTLNQPMSRYGRTIRSVAHYNGKQIDMPIDSTSRIYRLRFQLYWL
jgi:hypothetical protein